jgi:hypothetical protein
MNRIAYVAIITAGWSLSVFAAASALAGPVIAYRLALVAVIAGLGLFLWLDEAGTVEAPGLPLALVLLAPVICLTLAAVWWSLRLLAEMFYKPR